MAYADGVKEAELGVPDAGAARARRGLARDGPGDGAGGAGTSRGGRGVSVTGIAGPGGGTEEKPVGLVYLCASGPAGSGRRDFVVPGDRETVRLRAAVAALHLVRQLVTEL